MRMHHTRRSGFRQSAKVDLRSAKRALVDVDACPDEAFGLAEGHGAFTSEWHAHRKHQLLYAAHGSMCLVAGGKRWTLPPQRAAWIGAGTSHRVSSSTGIALRTVYFSEALAAGVPAIDCRVFAATPLAREMIVHAGRYAASIPGERKATDATRDAFFRALVALCSEWIVAEQPYYLPEPKTSELVRATSWIEAHLADATVEGAAAAARVSVRTLARRFEQETLMSFRAYLQAARMMRAMELLAEPGATVSATAYAVGFKSIGAFTAAFTERCGETPSAYRARVGSEGAGPTE